MGNPLKFGAVENITPAPQKPKPKSAGNPLNFGVATNINIPPKPKGQNLGRNPKSAQKIPAAQRRRPLEGETVYGEELFVSARRKEAEIVICFLPFTGNNIRISKDGKFAIKLTMLDVEDEGNMPFYSLFYFPTMLKYEYQEENPEPHTIVADLVPENPKRCLFVPDSCCVLVEKTSNLEEIRDKAVEKIKEEYFAAKQLKLANLAQKDKEDRIKKDLKEAEADKMEDFINSAPNFSFKKGDSNELDKTNDNKLDVNSNSKTNNAMENSSQETPIHKQEETKNEKQILSGKETGQSGIMSFGKVE